MASSLAGLAPAAALRHSDAGWRFQDDLFPSAPRGRGRLGAGRSARGLARRHPHLPAARDNAVPACDPAAADLRAALPRDDSRRLERRSHHRHGASAARVRGRLRGPAADRRGGVCGPHRRVRAAARRPLHHRPRRVHKVPGDQRGPEPSVPAGTRRFDPRRRRRRRSIRAADQPRAAGGAAVGGGHRAGPGAGGRRAGGGHAGAVP